MGLRRLVFVVRALAQRNLSGKRRRPGDVLRLRPVIGQLKFHTAGVSATLAGCRWTEICAATGMLQENLTGWSISATRQSHRHVGLPRPAPFRGRLS